MPINVTIWNEYRHEKQNSEIGKLYPNGMHSAIGDFLKKDSSFNIRLACLDDKSQGLSDDIINSTDVLIWWGHCNHNEVSDESVAKLADRARRGMGVIFLHSSHESKLFKTLTGCSGCLSWREEGETQIIWNLKPNHPITQGIKEYIRIEKEETYGEPFGIPEPTESIFMSWFSGGNVFRSGWVLNVQNGKIFYFQPGHESFPTYYNEDVLKVISNAVKYLVPVKILDNVKGVWQKESVLNK